MNDRTVLFVDDDQRLLMSLRRSFVDEPYNALFAGSGKEVLDILQQHEVHVIVTDLRMPEMSGLELLEIVKREYPNIVTIILSGQPHIPQAEISAMLKGLNQKDIFKITDKPFDMEHKLKSVVRQAMDSYEPHAECDVARKE